MIILITILSMLLGGIGVYSIYIYTKLKDLEWKAEHPNARVWKTSRGLDFNPFTSSTQTKEEPLEDLVRSYVDKRLNRIDTDVFDLTTCVAALEEKVDTLVDQMNDITG